MNKSGLIIVAVILLAGLVVGIPGILIGSHHLYGAGTDPLMLVVCYIGLIIFIAALATPLHLIGKKLEG